VALVALFMAADGGLTVVLRTLRSQVIPPAAFGTTLSLTILLLPFPLAGILLALDLLAWMPMLALTSEARLWEPRRSWFRLFTAAGQLVTTGRRRIPRLAGHWPWTSCITAALDRLAQLPNPG
ncbi:transposase, partial [Streptomyces sp. NPDC056159]|uniref:transposase n=1 Tax=Streptomyces sp. NPDC056159 TaxID=3155537 RepID=UPI0034376170